MAFLRNENVYVGTVRVSMYIKCMHHNAWNSKLKHDVSMGKLQNQTKRKILNHVNDDYLYVFSNISSIVVLFLFFLFEYLFLPLLLITCSYLFWNNLYFLLPFPWHFVLSPTGGLKQPLKRCEIVFNEYLIW